MLPAAALASPVISKAFVPPQIPLNAKTVLTFTISKADPSVTLTGVGFSHVLPAGLLVVSVSSTCGGGTITAAAGTNFISLAGATLLGGGSCTFGVTVKGTIAGVGTNVTGNVTSDQSLNGNTATASLTVVLPPTISKAFGAAKILLNGSTSLTFSITNPNPAVALAGLSFTDVLPPGLVVATPNGLTNTCGGAATATAGSGSVSLAAGALAANGTCTLTVNVISTTLGIKNNVSGAISSNEGGVGSLSNVATIRILALSPVISKAFGEVAMPVGSTTTLTFTIVNPNLTVGLTGIAFNDTLPGGVDRGDAHWGDR